MFVTAVTVVVDCELGNPRIGRRLNPYEGFSCQAVLLDLSQCVAENIEGLEGCLGSRGPVFQQEANAPDGISEIDD